MPRTNYNETWEKQPDGSMKLVERVEQVVSDEEIAREEKPARMRALAKKPVWTPAERDEVLKALLEDAYPERK